MNPVSQAIDHLIDLQLQRFAWLLRDAERIRAEDLFSREVGSSNKQPASNR
jgi:hypothetical protein